MIRVVIIGFGYWGPNIARNFHQNPDLELAGIADLIEERRNLAKKTYQNVSIYTDSKILIKEKAIDAVAIIT